MARNDQHGNEIMRVVLSTEPGHLTVASCQNLRINCGQQDPLNEGEGRFDHQQRFHYYAYGSKTSRCLGHKSQSVAEPIAQQEREKERKRTQKLLREKQSHSDDESAAWNTAEINAHSTFLSTGKQSDTTAERRVNSTPFYSWLSEKNKSQQQQVEDRRLMAQQADQRAVERAHLAHQKYQNWLKSKSMALKLRRGKSDLSSMQVSTTSRQSLAPDEAQRLLQEWEKEKLAAIKAKREKHKAKEEKQQLIDSTRRELSAEAWEQWVDASKSKPRPVPIGKGLDSLRGSMAPLFTNPNKWQPVLGNARRNSQSQAESSTRLRHGPDYLRLERLPQSQKKQWKPGEKAMAFGETSYRCNSVARQEKVRMEMDAVSQDSLLAVRQGGRFAAPQDSVGSISEMTETDTVDQQKKSEQQDDYYDPLEPGDKSLIWSKTNAQRVRELREAINPLDAGKPCLYQLEQLRRHQDLQNSKNLPSKFEEKREQLRETLKTWVTEGKLDLAHGNEDQISKKNQIKNISQLETNNNKKNEAKEQCSEDQMQSTTRNSGIPKIRARSTDPAGLLKFKEPKGSSKTPPWR